MTLLFVILSLVYTNSINSNINNYLTKDRIEYNEILIRDLQNINKLTTKSIYYTDNLPIYKPLLKDTITISSDYGYRFHPIWHIHLFHYGIDLPAKKGTPVLATAKGIVVKARIHRWGYGNMIVIDHGNNFKTMYAHLSSVKVKVGEHVNIGDIIGRVGSTGLSTGPHLHYGIEYKNKFIDPMFFTYNNKKERNKKLYLNNINIMNKYVFNGF